MSYAGSKRSVHVTLRQDLELLMRPVTREDKPLFAQGIREMSGTSRYLRFFSGFPEAPDSILNKLVDVDGQTHIAWCAIEVGTEPVHPVAAVHAVKNQDISSSAELAVAVVDTYQREGVARMLVTMVVNDCLRAGFDKCTAHILAENSASTHLFTSFGCRRVSSVGPDILYSVETSTALENLLSLPMPEEIREAV